MKIKTQFIICIVVFSIMLVIIAGSVATTQQQVDSLGAQEEISRNIERGASGLTSIAVDYFLYQEDLQLSRWTSALNSLSEDLSNLKSNGPQQTLTINIENDLQRLNALFNDVISYLQTASRNVSVRIDPAFQIRWSSLAVQSQSLAFDASQLSRSLTNQAHQINDTSTWLIVSLVATFGAFLATIYLMVFRRTLKSVGALQKGINTIGAGNLEYVIETKRQDEIAELSHSFNQMTANLKTVTASKADLEKAQASLKESEQRWATTLASIGDAVIATDVSGKIMFMNGIAEQLTGWMLSEASQKPVKEIFNIVNEQTRLEVEDPVSKVLEKGMIVGLANHTVLIRKDCTDVAIDDSGAPIKDKEGKTVGVVLIFRDITERKKTEEALKQNEQFYRTVFDNSQDGFQLIELIYDDNGKPYDHKYLKVNSAFEKIIGVKAEDIINKTARSVSPNCEPYWFEIPDRVVKTGRTEHVELYNKDINKYLDCYYFAYSKNVAGTLFRDISERKNLEKQLKDSERLAAIGATAGMVGHDIRNPLQAITSDVYLAKTELGSMPQSEEKAGVQESLTEIEKNIYYINKIVADLQDFARPLTPKLEEVDLEQTVHGVLAQLNIPGNVTVKHSIRNVPKIKIDQSYIQRILTNLANNAIQAMPHGGKLTIAASSKNGKATITVQDTGEGIPDEVRGKLFTPLMTTKSKGQGFGLSVVKRFTEALGGTVRFESEVGKGTKFIIELPV